MSPAWPATLSSAVLTAVSTAVIVLVAARSPRAAPTADRLEARLRPPLVARPPGSSSLTAPAPASGAATCAVEDRGNGRYEKVGRVEGVVGEVWLPPRRNSAYAVLIHLHGGAAAAKLLTPVLSAQGQTPVVLVTVDAGTGSKVYARAFWEPEPFIAILDEVQRRMAPAPRQAVFLSSWSAGYGGVREILEHHAA
ncbi:MAG: hypothetical protein AAGA56_08345, partial [Myxococcota bacterium]